MIRYFWMHKTWNLSRELQWGIVKIYSLRYKEDPSAARCASFLIIFNGMLHRSSFILLSKCQRGENLLLFEVISLKTAEERWINPRPWRCPPGSLSAERRRLCPRVPQSSRPLGIPGSGDTGAGSAGAGRWQQGPLRSTRRPGRHTRLWASPDALGAALSWREREIQRKQKPGTSRPCNRNWQSHEHPQHPGPAPAPNRGIPGAETKPCHCKRTEEIRNVPNNQQ